MSYNCALATNRQGRFLGRKSIYAWFWITSIEFGDPCDIWTAKAGLHPLKNHSNPLANADAHGRQPKLCIAVVHGVDERRGDTGPGGSEWMADCDPAAADVDVRFVHSEHADAGDRLSGKGFVDLDQINVFQREPGPLELFLGSGHRAGPHNGRI